MSDIREDLKAFVDGELTPARASEIEAAIGLDPELRQEVQFLRALGAEIKHIASDPEVKGTEDALAKVRPRRRSFLLDGWILGSTGMATILLVLLNPLFSQESADRGMTLPAEYADSGVRAKALSESDKKQFGGTGSVPTEPLTSPANEPERTLRFESPKDAGNMPPAQQGQGFAQQRPGDGSAGRSVEEQDSASTFARGQVEAPKGKGGISGGGALRPPETLDAAPPVGGPSANATGGAAKTRSSPSATKGAEGGPPVSVPPKPAATSQKSFGSALTDAASFLLVRSPIWAPIILFGWLMSWRRRRA